MNLDRFMITSGLAVVDGDLEEEARELLVESAEHFLRAGGTVTLTEWEGLSMDSRSAFVTAGDRQRALAAYLFGAAARSKAEGLAILSTADGGDQLVRELLEKTTEIAADRIEAKRPLEVKSL